MLPPPILPHVLEQNKKDSEHLRLLAVFHFVKAGLSLLGVLFLLLHRAIFSFAFSNPKMWENKNPSAQGPGPEEFQEFFQAFQWFYLCFGLWFLLAAVINLLSGLFLRSRKHRTFSIVVGGMNCLHVPLGTILGVFTIMILMRDSVRDSYRS